MIVPPFTGVDAVRGAEGLANPMARPGRAVAVAAGRVYAQPAVLDLRTGRQRGVHPTFPTAIRIR